MVHVILLLLLVCSVRHFISHRSDPEYIIIKPRLLFLNETESTREVQITCRHLPMPAQNHQSRLTILRRPFRTDNTTAVPEKLADVITSRAATTFGAGEPPRLRRVGGRVPTTHSHHRESRVRGRAVHLHLRESAKPNHERRFRSDRRRRGARRSSR